MNWMRVVLASNNIELLTYSHKNKLIDLSPNENKPPYAMKFLLQHPPGQVTVSRTALPSLRR